VPGTKTDQKPKGTTREERRGFGSRDRFSSARLIRREKKQTEKKADGSQTHTHTETGAHAMFEEIFVVL